MMKTQEGHIMFTACPLRRADYRDSGSSILSACLTTAEKILRSRDFDAYHKPHSRNRTFMLHTQTQLLALTTLHILLGIFEKNAANAVLTYTSGLRTSVRANSQKHV